MCVSNNDRNPDINHFGGSCIEIVNNIFYNAKSEWLEVFSQFAGGTPVTAIGNVFKAGPDTKRETHAILWQQQSEVAKPKIYAEDNHVVDPGSNGMSLYGPGVTDLLISEPSCPLSVPVQPAKEIYGEIRASSGAFPRDALDKAYVSQVGDFNKEGKGKLRKSAGELHSSTDAAAAYADADHDGMDDQWEVQNGLDANVFDAWNDHEGDGEANLDAFMQYLVTKNSRIVAGQ
jgi:pectate lyase